MIMMSTLTEALSSLLEMNYLPVYEFFSNPPNDYYGTGNVVSRVAYATQTSCKVPWQTIVCVGIMISNVSIS